ncbi:binding-protein-dependent transport systems inner membrane component [Alicyclobacillus hesperidum URH17-3-68]|nr:binding-protein-dependent transport systems inner membrane component [Alicyclobacillus hesperidum URH17-3-68]
MTMKHVKKVLVFGSLVAATLLSVAPAAVEAATTSHTSSTVGGYQPMQPPYPTSYPTL